MRLTRRNLLGSLMATVTAGLACPWVRPSYAGAGNLNLYNWADYIGETTIADFQSETGISVIYDLYSSAEEMQARMLAGSTGYDLVIQDGLALQELIAAGIYQKLERTRLKNWGNLDPALLKVNEGFDPGNQYGLPYAWGTVGLTFNMALIHERLPDADLSSLDVIFNPENAAKLSGCGISLLDSPTDLGFMVLSWLGVDPDKAGPADYDRMIEAFRPIRKYVAAFDNANYVNGLSRGRLCVANSWSGDYLVAKARAKAIGVVPDLKYFVPKTGVPAWFDLWCMPSDARNLDSAYAFLDYMLRPDVAARCTNFTGYANANKAATPLLDPTISSDPAIYPDAETLGRMYTPKAITPEQERALNKAWARIKAG